MNKEVDISALLGKTLILIVGAEKDSNKIIFTCSDGSAYEMYHRQDCCESVYLEDVCGDLGALIGCPILKAEMLTNSSTDEVHNNPVHKSADSYTWTFYSLATIKGFVTIRWYGESNGYYSEEVSIELIKEPIGQLPLLSVKYVNTFHSDKSLIGVPVKEAGSIIGTVVDVTDEYIIAEIKIDPERINGSVKTSFSIEVISHEGA